MSDNQAEKELLPECNWPRCRRSPNPCFAWCKCLCHAAKAAATRARRAEDRKDPRVERDERQEVISDAIWDHAVAAVSGGLPKRAQEVMAIEDVHAIAHSLVDRLDEAGLTVVPISPPGEIRPGGDS